jgi:hypothetical protein
LPEGSPGEWFTIYPPFPKRLRRAKRHVAIHERQVTPIVAGELAAWGFSHGFEDYGVDVLNRLFALGKEHGGTFHSSYTGAMPKPKKRTFSRSILQPLPTPTPLHRRTGGAGLDRRRRKRLARDATGNKHSRHRMANS